MPPNMPVSTQKGSATRRLNRILLKRNHAATRLQIAKAARRLAQRGRSKKKEQPHTHITKVFKRKIAVDPCSS
jgi:hypothetical protein